GEKWHSLRLVSRVLSLGLIRAGGSSGSLIGAFYSQVKGHTAGGTCIVPKLRPPHHERTPADRFRPGIVGTCTSPAQIVHAPLALARVQSEPRRALDRQELARFGPTTPKPSGAKLPTRHGPGWNWVPSIRLSPSTRERLPPRNDLTGVC